MHILMLKFVRFVKVGVAKARRRNLAHIFYIFSPTWIKLSVEDEHLVP